MKGAGEELGEAAQRRGRLMGEAGGGVFRVPDRDLLEILDAPEVAVLADRPQVEAGDAERLGAHLGIPAVEPPEIEVGRAVGQQPRLDRVEIVDEEQEHVAVRGIERRRLFRHVNARVVDAGRPVEHARHLPARVAGAVARDALHGGDQFVVVDAAIVGAGHGAQLRAAIRDLHGLDLLGAVVGQTVLQVDPRQRRGQLPQIGRRRADEAGELAEGPMRRRDRLICARQDKSQLLRVVAMRLDPDRRTLHRARPAPLRPALDDGEEIVERQIPLVIRPREPLGRHAVHVRAARHIHLVAAADVMPGIDDFGILRPRVS